MFKRNVFTLNVIAISFSITTGLAQADQAPFKTLNSKELAQKLEKPQKESDSLPTLHIYDVNVESTRKNAGIIPGSALLSSSKEFNIEKELPKNKKAALIFYCANQMCTASHTAANRAIQNGYQDVSVMTDGIYGWKKAGYPTEKAQTQPYEIEPQAAADLQKLNSVVIVDVRETEERHEIIPQSLWIPMSKAQNTKEWTEFSKQLPKNKTIVFHCAVGMRAKTAAGKLTEMGFKTAYFQGPDQWRKAGLKVSPGPAQSD